MKYLKISGLIIIGLFSLLSINANASTSSVKMPVPTSNAKATSISTPDHINNTHIITINPKLHASNTHASTAVSMPIPVSTEHMLDQVVAIVNDDIITQSELNHALRLAQQHAHATHLRLPAPEVFKKIVLNQLINRHLQLQLAKRNKIQITPQQVDNFLAHMAKQNRITVKQLLTHAKKQGYNTARFRHEISQEIMIRQLQMGAVGRSIKVTKTDINQLKKKIIAHQQTQQQYSFIDFLVQLPDQPTASQVKDAKKIAADIYAKLSKGSTKTKFRGAKTSYQHSQQANDIPQLFLKTLGQLKENQTSRPMRAGNGYHVIKLIWAHSAKTKLPSNAQLQAIVFQQKSMQALSKWIETLRKQSYIKIQD